MLTVVELGEILARGDCLSGNRAKALAILERDPELEDELADAVFLYTQDGDAADVAELVAHLGLNASHVRALAKMQAAAEADGDAFLFEPETVTWVAPTTRPARRGHDWRPRTLLVPRRRRGRPHARRARRRHRRRATRGSPREQDADPPPALAGVAA
jgi:hypothetical protein